MLKWSKDKDNSTYSLPEDTIARLDIMSKKQCLYFDCDNEPLYSYKGTKCPLFCEEHKYSQMINVYLPICQYDDCINQAIHCEIHKQFNMTNASANYNIAIAVNLNINKSTKFVKLKRFSRINRLSKNAKPNSTKYIVYDKVDKLKKYSVDKNGRKNKLCILKTCFLRASFNYLSMKPEFCSKHKLDGMVNTYRPICVHMGCLNRAIYNFKDRDVKAYCTRHKQASMIEIKFKSTKKDKTSCNI